VGRSKYNWEEIVKDYLNGMSLTKISEKHGISIAACHEGIRKRGIRTRNLSDALLGSQWRKLVKMKKGATRLLSLPLSVYSQLGFEPKDELEGKWVVKNIKGKKKLALELRKRPKSLNTIGISNNGGGDEKN